MKSRYLITAMLLAAVLTVLAGACGAAPQTVTVPGTSATVTLTKTATSTTTVAGPGGTVTVTQPGGTITQPGTSKPPVVFPTISIPPQITPTVNVPLPTFTVIVPTLTIPQPTVIIPTATFSPPYPMTTSPGNIGLSAGGAKDIQNFRENITNGYLPLPTDVTYEGLFYDYYFDTGETEPGSKLFNPSYVMAVTADPLSGQPQYYLAVGLNSGMKESDFARKKLNLVIVLDISGSMGESYNRYYYDQWGVYHDINEEGGQTQRKIDSARDSVIALLGQLGPDDSFAIVLYNSKAMVLQPMSLVGSTDMQRVIEQVRYIDAGGSTNLDAGMDLANAQFRGLRELDSYEYENRVMIISDAQPNTGDSSSYGFMSNMKNNAESRIYTTFIGVGVDFNSSLVEQITKVKGANYYSVHSYDHFRQRIQEEFDFMVTPLVFDLKLYFEADGWRIDKVFGSPEADAATGSLMYINTLFPAKSVGGENRGGIVLLKLTRIYANASGSASLKVSYEDRNGVHDTSSATAGLTSEPPEYFANTGIRKAVLLTRYAALLKSWLMDERNHAHISYPWDPCIDDHTGIRIPDESLFSQWERTSLPLSVSPQYRAIFKNFAAYFESEMDAIGDNTLSQELLILKKLASI